MTLPIHFANFSHYVVISTRATVARKITKLTSFLSSSFQPHSSVVFFMYILQIWEQKNIIVHSVMWYTAWEEEKNEKKKKERKGKEKGSKRLKQ
jgi:hypothetical protein